MDDFQKCLNFRDAVNIIGQPHLILIWNEPLLTERKSVTAALLLVDGRVAAFLFNEFELQMSDGPTTSSELLRRVIAGEDDAWIKFNQIYTKMFYGWARASGLGDADALEVAQNVLLKLLFRIRTFEQRPGSKFRSWLKRVVNNAIIDQYRKESTNRATVDSQLVDRVTSALNRSTIPDLKETHDDHQFGLLANLAEEIIFKAHQIFEPKTFAAFHMTAVDRIPTKEVAEELGMSTDSVRKAKSRVTKRLFELFGERFSQVIGESHNDDSNEQLSH